MAELSSDLFAQIVRFCEPHFRLPADRDALLIVPLRGWDGYHRLDWAGSPHVFTVRLVELLPPDRLQAVLQALPVGHAQQQTAAALCGQIDADQGVLAAG
ncbi:MAG: hypothetical protein KC425_10805, partial [Anaerolineales bacterium]|nr:hypothetical protein [Anaerolineales bacterium]